MIPPQCRHLRLCFELQCENMVRDRGGALTGRERVFDAGRSLLEEDVQEVVLARNLGQYNLKVETLARQPGPWRRYRPIRKRSSFASIDAIVLGKSV